jgi:hypothetical protein
MSNEDRSPRDHLADPAHAIIAALSVHSSSGGTSTRMPSAAPTSSIRSRSLELATTPPPSAIVGAPVAFAAAIVFDTCTSTIAYW